MPSPTVSDEPLVRSLTEGNEAAFRDGRGNAQLVLIGEGFSNGVWAVAIAAECLASLTKTALPS